LTDEILCDIKNSDYAKFLHGVETDNQILNAISECFNKQVNTDTLGSIKDSKIIDAYSEDKNISHETSDAEINGDLFNWGTVGEIFLTNIFNSVSRTQKLTMLKSSLVLIDSHVAVIAEQNKSFEKLHIINLENQITQLKEETSKASQMLSRMKTNETKAALAENLEKELKLLREHNIALTETLDSYKELLGNMQSAKYWKLICKIDTLSNKLKQLFT
jgi:hypothetical protein